MTPTKPDWAERAVEKYTFSMQITNKGAAQLLRAERRRTVRIITSRIKEVERSIDCQENTSYRLALVDLLAALRGKR